MFKTHFRLHFIVLLWGFTGVLGKLISLSALPIVFWRTLFSFLTIGIALKLVGVSLKVSRKQLWSYLGVGAIIGSHWTLFFAAIKVSNVSVALSTMAVAALFTALIEPFFYKRKINAVEIVLSLVVVICLWLIFKASPAYLTGIILGIIAAFLAALMTVINGVLQKNRANRPRIMMFYEMIGAFIFVSLMLPFFLPSFDALLMKGNDWFWLVILGAVLTAFPMIESVQLMKYISPYSLVLAVNMEPIYSIILAYFIFGDSERMSTTFYIAALVMIVIIVLNQVIQIQIRKKQKRKLLHK